MRILLILSTELVAVAHLTMAVVLFIYSRRSVAYLAQAWISLLTFVLYAAALVAVVMVDRTVEPMGVLNPQLLVAGLIVSFLLSISPLGMVMPGYLQAVRMLKYASPAAVIILIYTLGFLAGGRVVVLHGMHDIMTNLLTGDVLLRLATLVLSSYYIINILVLPHRLIKKGGYSLPKNVVTYATLFGIVQIFFFAITIWFSYPMIMVYEILFTAVSIMLSGCMIKEQLTHQPYPRINPVEAPPTQEEIIAVETRDFNEANVCRFESIEYAMQHDKPYVSPDFTRDNLCRLCGLNRHMLLQALRSQGYNDVHDYISRYRVSELRRLIEEGEINDVHQHVRVGFRTLKTAVLAFERYEHEDLAAFVARHQGGAA